jgi:hypothetical protein
MPLTRQGTRQKRGDERAARRVAGGRCLNEKTAKSAKGKMLKGLEFFRIFSGSFSGISRSFSGKVVIFSGS